MTNKDIQAKLAGEPNNTKAISIGDIDNLLSNFGTTEGKLGALGSFVAPEGQYKGTLSGQGVFDQYAPVDLQDLQARQQTTGEKWQNGAIKFGSQVGTGVVGNIANLFYGTGAAIVNQDFNKWFDNDFTQALDSWDDSMREDFQNFKTTEQQNRAWYQNILGDGGANFWADDFLGGMAFTVSAVLSEIALTAATTATFGATSGLQAGVTARILARGARMLDKGGDATKAIGSFAGARNAINIGNKVDKGLLFTRRLATGAGYEAGVEARGFKDEAWGEKLREIGIGSKEELQESNPELFASTEEAINNASNYVFAGNMALVGASNFVTLPKTFGKGLFKSGAINKKILSPTRVTGKEGAYTVAYDNWSKARKIGYTTRKLAERPLTEGLFEEGGQGFVKQTGLEYISKKYSSEGVSNNYDLVDALGDAFGETYGSSFDNEFWKEVGIGMIIGSLGSPTFTSANLLEDGWQGSLVGAYRDIGKNIESAKKIIDVANKNKGLSKLAIMQKAANVSFESNKEMNTAYEKKDYFRGKNAESREFFNMVSNRYQLGVSDQMLEDTIAEVQAMEAEEFAETFGYEGNMTKEELEARKKEVVETATDNTNKTIKSIREAEKTIQDYNFVTEEGSLNSLELIEALAYNDYMVSDLDTREFKLSDEISKNLGIDARTLIDIRNENQSVRMTKKWIENFKSQHDELKAAEKELEDAEKSEESSDNIEILRKKVGRQKSRYYRAVKKEHAKRKETTNNGKKYDRDFESFKNVVEETIALQDKINGLYFDKPARKKNVESMLNDLNSMATQRKNYNADTRTLLSIDGFKVFNKSLDELREAATKDARVNLLKSYSKTIGKSETLSKEQKEEVVKILEEAAKKAESEQVELNEVSTASDNKYINTVIETINNHNKKAKTKTEFNAYLDYLHNAKKRLVGKINSEDDGTEGAEAIMQDYNELLNTINDRIALVERKIGNLEVEETVKSYKGFGNVLNSLDSFVRFFNKNEKGEDINIDEALKGVTWDQIKTGLNISVERWDNAPKEAAPAKNKDGSKMDTDVSIQSAYIDENGEKYAIRLYVGDTLIGALSPPNKFEIKGKPIDFNVLEEGKAVNPNFNIDELAELNRYQKEYAALIKRSLNGDIIRMEELSTIVDFKLYLKELNYIPKGKGRTKVKDSKHTVKLGNLEGHLLYNRNGYTLTSEDEEGNTVKTKGSYMFLTGGQKLVLSRDSNPVLYGEANKIFKDMSISSAEFTSKLTHSDLLVIPRGDDFGFLGLDYPFEEDNAIDDETLQSTFKTHLEKFRKYTDKENNNNAAGGKKSLYHMPLTVTVTRTGSNAKINMDITIPLLRTKDKDGKWSDKITLYGNAKATGPTSDYHSLFLGLTYDDNFENVKLKLSDDTYQELTVENLKQAIDSRISWSTTQKDRRTGTINVANIITENGQFPTGNVTVNNIFPSSVATSKENLEIAAEPAGALIRTTRSRRLKSTTSEKYKPKPGTKKETTKEEEGVSPTPPTPPKSPTANHTPEFNEHGVDIAALNWEEDSGSLSPAIRSILTDMGTPENALYVLENEVENSVGNMHKAITKFFKKNTGKPGFNLQAIYDFQEEKEEEFEEKQFKKAAKESKDGPAVFSTKPYDGKVESFATIRDTLAKILPSSIKLENLQDVLERLEANGEVFGVFMDNIIYLDKNKATKGLAYHEAFHAVFRTLFNEEEKSELLALASEEFGIPTQKQLKELKDVSTRYKSYSKEKLSDLWLEEKLADKFATHKPNAENKSWFQKIVDKIKKWLGFIQNKSISSIFDDIYRGSYKNKGLSSNIVNSDPAFMLLKTKSNKHLSARNSEIVLSRIHMNFNSIEDDVPFNDKVTLAIKKTEEEFNKDVNTITVKSRSMSYSIKGRGLEENERAIREALSTRLGVFNFTNGNKIDQEEDLEQDDEGEERIYDEDIGKYKGIKSLSKRIRSYLTSAFQHEDFLGLNLTEEQLQDDRWKVSVNHDRVYDALVRGLADVSEQNIIPRIYYLAQFDTQIKTFFDKLVLDIHEEAGIKEAYNPEKRQNYNNSTLFRELVANFDNTKVDFLSMIYDKVSGQFRIFTSNRKNVGKQQITGWSQNFNANRKKVTPAKASDFIEGEILNRYYPAIKTENKKTTIEGIGTWVTKLEANSRYVQKHLKEQIGLSLHINYIKWSMIKDNLSSTNVENIEGEPVENSLQGLLEYYQANGNENAARIEYLIDFYETFKEAGNSLDEEVNGEKLLSRRLLNILRDTSENNNPFTLQSEDIDDETPTKEGAGAVTRFKFVAEANAMFDTSIAETTFRNNEGNMISDKIKNSFYTDMFKLFKQKDFKNLFSQVKEGTADWKDLKYVLETNQVHYTDDFIKMYFESLRNNPLVMEDHDFIFSKDRSVEIVGGMREVTLDDDGSLNTKKDYKDGKDFKSMTPIERIVFNMYNFAADRKSHKGKLYARYSLEVYEAKNTNYLFTLPVKSFIDSKGNPNKEFLNNYYNLFLTEFNITKLEGLTDSFSDFNDSEEGRKNKFFKFGFLSDELKSKLYETEIITDELEADIKRELFSNANNRINGFIKGIKEEDATSLLPRSFVTTKKENYKETVTGIKRDEVAEYVLNNFINSFAYSDMINGSDMVGHSSLVDIFKRGAGKVASGSSLGSGTTTIATIKDYQIPGVHYRTDKDGNRTNMIEEAGDGQTWSTMGWKINTYLRGLGKYRKELEKSYTKNNIGLLDKIRLGIELNTREMEILKKHNALFNSLKIVGRDAQTYLKTSIHTISREDVSKLSPRNYEAANDLLRDIKEIEISGENKHQLPYLFEQLHSLYTAHPHRKQMHDMLNDMEMNGTDLVAYESASKTSRINVTDYDNDRTLKNIEMSNRFLREQVNTDGFKEEIIDGTQLLNLIWSEQSPEKQELVSKYKNYIAERAKEGFNILEGTIFKLSENGKFEKADYKKLYKQFKDNIAASLEDPYLTQLFELDDNNEPVFDNNWAAVVSKFESMFLSYVSKEAFKFKSKGRKYTLTANAGYEVKVDENDNVIPTDSNDKHARTRRLKYDPTTGIAEVIVSKYAVKEHLKEIRENGGYIPAYLAEQLGFRIPTQDNSSVVKLKIVDLIGGAYGSTIIIPSEINEIAGSDFDVDSLFAKIYNTHNGGKFGGYRDIENETDAIEAAISEIRASKKTVEAIKEAAMDLSEDLRNYIKSESNNENQLNLPKLLDELSEKSPKVKFARDKIYMDLGIFNEKSFKESSYYDKFIQARKGNTSNTSLTREELENHILDSQMELAFNEHSTETSEREPILDAYAYLESQGIELKDGISGVHDPASQLNAHKANYAGNGGIGPMALFNIAFQYMRDAGAKFTEIVDSKQEIDGIEVVVKKKQALEVYPEHSSFTVDKAGKYRVNKLISSFITAFTDNAKHYDSEKMGINKDTISHIAILFAAGVPLREAVPFMLQDSVQSWKRLKSKGGWIDEKDVNDSLKEIAKTQKFSVEDINIAFSSPQMFDFSHEELLINLKFQKDGYKREEEKIAIGDRFISPELKRWVDINKQTYNYFSNVDKIANEIFHFTRVLSLSKGVSKTTANVENILTSAEKIGIGFNRGYKVTTKLEKVPTTTNWFTIVNKNKPVERNLLSLKKLNRAVLKEFLISYTKGGMDLLQSAVMNNKSHRFNSEDGYKQLLGDFNSFLQIKAFMKQTSVGKFEFEKDFFNREFDDTFTEMLKLTTGEDAEFADNKLLQQIRKRYYKFGEKSDLSGMLMSWGEINTNSKKDADNTIELMDGYTELVQSKNPLANKLAKLIFKQVAIKDNFKFKSSSLIRLISLSYLKENILDYLPKIRKTLDSGTNADYKKLFGMTLNELRDDFVKNYSRNVTNFKNVRSMTGKQFNAAMNSNNAVIAIQKKLSTEKHGIYKPKSIKEAINNSLITAYGNKLTFNALASGKKNDQVGPNTLALKKTRLFDTVWDNVEKRYRIAFPRVFKIERDYYQLEENTRSQITKGYQATYVKVSRTGNYIMSPYAFTLEQWDELAASQEEAKKPIVKAAVKVGKNTKDQEDTEMEKEVNSQRVTDEFLSELGTQVLMAQGLTAETIEETLRDFKNSKKGYDKAGELNKKKAVKLLEKMIDEGNHSVDLDLDYEVTSERIEDIEVIEAMATKLTKKFSKFVKGVVYTDKIPGKGMYHKGIVYINPNKITKDTLFHEFAHPFVAAIREDNPVLYANLYKSLENSKKGAEIIAKINKAYKYKTKEMFMDEAIVTALGINTATLKDRGLESYITQFWNKIRNYIKNLLNNPFAAVIVSQIDSNTSLRELSTIMLTDNSIKRDLIAAEVGNTYSKEVAFRKVNEINNKLNKKAVIAVAHMDGAYKIQSLVSENVIEIIKELEKCQ